MMKLLCLAVVASCATAEVLFSEDFNDATWEDRWVKSDMGGKKAEELGEFTLTAGKVSGEADNQGIKTGPDARFFGLSAKMGAAIAQTDKPLVLQFSVKHEQNIDCGGGYIKLMPPMDQATFGGDAPYGIMFGPDICGTSTRKTHVIFGYDKTHADGPRENLLIKKDVRCESDELTHLYTLIVSPDNTYEVQIDQKKVESGNLKDDWAFLAAEEIKDPEQSKPSDWVDEKQIPDPEDVKPEGYDDIPKQLPDPAAEKPDDWDDEDDGEWEAPMIDNAEYKGPFEPKMIENPDYKGEWVHPMVANPEFKDDAELFKVCDGCDTVAFELWQVKAGTIFDDIVVTDSADDAKTAGDKVMTKIAAEKEADEAEKAKAAEKAKKEREEADAKKAEETEKADAADDEEDEEEEDEEEDEETAPKEEL